MTLAFGHPLRGDMKFSKLAIREQDLVMKAIRFC